DRLGYDRPSKAVDWLIDKAKNAIAKLDELPDIKEYFIASKTIDETFGVDDTGKRKARYYYILAMGTSIENSLYYLSWTLVGAKLKYTAMEMVCLALVFALGKLKQYLGQHTNPFDIQG
ncbi:hypothetical protein RJ639_033512, partial [Escallonia herrerae]